MGSQKPENTRAEPPGTMVFLIRHADASVGPRDKVHGRHLTPLGQRQAAALALRLAHWPVDAILCSDKYRSHETALAIAHFHLHVPLSVDPDFREVSRGDLEGFERGDEDQEDLPERLEAAWDKILHLTSASTVIVAHNGLIKYFLGKVIKSEGVLKPRFHSTETGITGIHLRPKPLLDFFNDTHHLTEELVTPGPKPPWIEAQPGRIRASASAGRRPGA